MQFYKYFSQFPSAQFSTFLLLYVLLVYLPDYFQTQV